jgi:putative nucleotidyltransferase with HDIG domain
VQEDSTSGVIERQSQTIRRLCNLPRLNPGATRLLAVSAESDSELEQFEEIFGSDPALTAELLLVANSAEFGLRGSVPNIKFALMLLGTERIRRLAVTLAFSRYARSAGNVAKPLWEHCLATAVVAEEIGRQYGAPTAHLYTAGLTHDLGRLGLLLTGSDQYADVLAQKFRDINEANELERVRFGVSHCEAGAYLAKSWQFPLILCRAIQHHHDPLTQGDDDFLRITQAACVVAGEIGYPEAQLESSSAELHTLNAELLKRRELDSERLKELVIRRMESTPASR